MKSLSFRENIWNLTRNVYLMSIFSITTSRYQRHILVWCLIYTNAYLIYFLCWYPSVESMKSAFKKLFTVDFSSAAIFYWPFSSVIDRNRKSSEEGGTSIVNHFHQQPRVTWSILTTKVNVKNTCFVSCLEIVISHEPLQ